MPAQTGKSSAGSEFSSHEPVSRNPVMSEPPKDSLADLLKATSRSFYLTLHVLPATVRPQIGLVKRIGLAREGALKF